MAFHTKSRRVVSAVLALWLLGVIAFGTFVAARPTYAAEGAASTPVVGILKSGLAACRGANTAVSPDVCEGMYSTADETDKSIIKPAMQVAIISALLNVATYALDRVAYEAATWVSSGAPGGLPLIFSKDAVHAYGEFGLDVVGDAIGELSSALNTVLDGQFDLCQPSDPLFTLGLQLGLKQAYKPTAPKCNFRDIASNWDSFISTTVSTASNPSQVVLKAFAEGFKPGQNELSASVKLNIEVNQRMMEKKTNLLKEQLAGNGFKNVTNVITGQVKTPSAVLNTQFNDGMSYAKESKTEMNMKAFFANTDLLGPMFLQVAGVFTNTLLSSLMNKVYTGLFTVQPTDDPFDAELASVPSRDEVAKQFASLITSHPSQISNYNVLNEFVTCPSSGLGVRNLTQCVMDQNFSTAILRSESGTPLTVQQAIDEGLLNGGWSLIPNEGDGIVSNQDLLCYTYGYCYSNLVKMRKARVIPVGWEIAASTNDPTNPHTLQEIIDGFNSCDADGAIDSSHPWCHLVDPNWVLKYPQTQCRAYVNGEVQISTLAAGRAGSCADTPSCIAEDNDGNCSSGYGYCTQEKNVWKFKGTECPAEDASCMIFNNTDTNAKSDFLLNTVNFANCNADNAGCLWYRTNKYLDDAGTPSDTTDDTYSWLPTGDDFVTADREDDVRKATTTGSMVAATNYAYDTNGDGPVDYSYDTYAYQDRVYYNNNISSCDASAAGCTAVYKINDTLELNLVQNASFEDDADADGLPDNWSGVVATSDVATTDFIKTGGAYFGDNYVRTSASSTAITEENIRLAPDSFYTLSFYAKGAATTDTATVDLGFTAADGSAVSLAGTSSLGDCTINAAAHGAFAAYASYTTNVTASTSWTQYSCTFTTESEPLNATIALNVGTSSVSFDSIQLQLGEDATTFTEGYSAVTPSTSYLLMPPAYLNCTGAATDPDECDSYTQICTARNVGCNLYTPDNGDPAVPAIAAALDSCPSECVGYASYKQEATDRQVESFPLYFIADRATACSAEQVGCDAFTNLDSTASGGEGTEYYTDVRSCLKTSMTNDSAATGKKSATYFTWEGSDAAGYQLVTWTLLQSNFEASTVINYTEASSTAVNDGTPSDGPCVSRVVTSESDVSCNDMANGTAVIEEDDACNEHSDIFANPDCREFYDVAGKIHYREYSQTVSISDDCHPYRFTAGNSEDCSASGGFWTSVGDCRYFGLPSESVSCPATAAGCRSYTGGGGRNATTVFSDDFEDGALTEYYADSAGPTIDVSNESVATGGHSMRVEVKTTATHRAVTTFTNFVNAAQPTATCATSSGCEITDANGNVCTVAEGESSCGTLHGKIVSGKTYQLSFWAKGSQPIRVSLVDNGGRGTATAHDLVDPTNAAGTLTDLAIDAGWHEYVLGPLDTSDAASFGAFDDTAVLSFSSRATSIFYLDNVRLKELEDNVTLVQDSWVVPSTCDQTPDGASAPQYYLGCQAYTDQRGDAANLYQFSDLCSEDVVGCEAAYDTKNSDDAFAMTYNARCVNVNADGTDATVPANTACVLDDVTACTIAVGESFCLFDRAGSLPSVFPYKGDAAGNLFSLELGPEAAAVDGDSPVYVVDNGTSSCTFDNVGCQEIGLPTYDQAKENVTGFSSQFVINDPDDYANVLCENRSLFCAEWTSTQDGNFYFKDPIDQTCEYKTNVTVNGSVYSGWFKTGTTEACDTSYVKGGSQNGIWRNGDDAYSDWVGTCTDAYDLCTEFLDVSDTSQGTWVDGTPYNFINDDTLLDDALTATDQCGGQVSQKSGCALFDDTTDSTFSYATLPSYLASTHADVLYGGAAASKVDPISCQGGGEDITTPAGDSVNLCDMRCRYSVPADVSLRIGNAIGATVGSLVSNGDFETAGTAFAANWTSESMGGTASFGTDGGHGGIGYLSFSGTADAYSDSFALASGTTYDLSFYANMSDTTNSHYSNHVDVSGGSIDTTSVTGDCSAASATSLTFTANSTASVYAQKTCEFTMTTGGTARAYFGTAAAGATMKVDDVVLVNASESASYAGVCLTNADCPPLDGDDSVAYTGTCVNVLDLNADGTTTTDDTDPTAVFSNDANRVIKVYRDRECAEWSMCGQSRVSWNTSTSKYDSICEQIVACDQTAASGDQTVCTSFPTESPVPLTPQSYSMRDVTWGGNDFSGYTIPGVVPVEYLTEVNIEPDLSSEICWVKNDSGIEVPQLDTDGAFVDCSDGVTTDCNDTDRLTLGQQVICEKPASSLRLAHSAGPCDQSAGWGSECTIGYCADDHAQTCQASSDCGTGVQCVIGFCQMQGATCTSDADCSDTTPYCDSVYGLCVDDLSPSDVGCFDDLGCSAGGFGVTNVCRPDANAFTGSCINDQCLVGADGSALILVGDATDPTKADTQNAEPSSCRGYPEVSSPFSPFSSTSPDPGIVDMWVSYESTTTDDGATYTITGTASSDISELTKDAVPYTYASGFQGQNVCAPVELSDGSIEVTDACDCSYTKVSYGTGVNNRYYSTTDADSDSIPEALCVGGPANGMNCTDDSASCGSGGTCTVLSRKDSYNGWQGYCLERDLSINLYGNANLHPCITWLPVDALAGSTDLYGKSAEAGFPLENQFYCSQTGYYVDLYPTGAEMTDGQMTSIDLACASTPHYGWSTGDGNSTVSSWGGRNGPKPEKADGTAFTDDASYGNAHCSYGQYDGCEENVICPEGYVGVVGYCNQKNDGTQPVSDSDAADGDVCEDIQPETSSTGNKYPENFPRFDANGAGTDATTDCPYFCVPKNSKHVKTGLDCLGTEFTDMFAGTSRSDVYYGGNFYIPLWTNVDDSTTQETTLQYFADCAVRGIPYVADEVTAGGETYSLNWTKTQTESGTGFATGFNSPESGISGGGYAFVNNASSGQIAYGIANRAVGAEMKVCSNTGRMCDDVSECTGDSVCSTFCDLVDGGHGAIYDACNAACYVLTITVPPTCDEIPSTQNTSGNIYPYLGCYEVAQTAASIGDSEAAADGTFNKAWTNRVLENTYSMTGASFAYTSETSPTPAGALPFEGYYTVGTSGDSVTASFNNPDTVQDSEDAFPLPVAAINDTPTTSGLTALATHGGESTCENLHSYPGTGAYADSTQPGCSYEDVDSGNYETENTTDELDAIDGNITKDFTVTSTVGTVTAGDDNGEVGILQFFAKVIRKFYYDYGETGVGSYVLEAGSEVDDTSAADQSAADVADANGTGNDNYLDPPHHAPTVKAVGYCVGTQCEEGEDGTISVNSQSEGNVYGQGGQVFTSVSFFAYANPNQMPIRNINVDWGDDRTAFGDNFDVDWPTGSQGGSTTLDNFYKNFRGYDANNVALCNETNDGWGGNASACQQGYVTFTNAYTCSQTDVTKLENSGRFCKLDSLGHLLQSPCTGSDASDASTAIPNDTAAYASGACVFQPRVSVLDNWGWCTGECDGGSDGTGECYTGDRQNGECDIQNCPSSVPGQCQVQDSSPSGTDNPWINFNGYVIVTPP